MQAIFNAEDVADLQLIYQGCSLCALLCWDLHSPGCVQLWSTHLDTYSMYTHAHNGSKLCFMSEIWLCHNCDIQFLKCGPVYLRMPEVTFTKYHHHIIPNIHSLEQRAFLRATVRLETQPYIEMNEWSRHYSVAILHIDSCRSSSILVVRSISTRWYHNQYV